MKSYGLDINLEWQPLKPPKFNVLDLSLFYSSQKTASTINDGGNSQAIVACTKKTFKSYTNATLECIWQFLENVLKPFSNQKLEKTFLCITTTLACRKIVGGVNGQKIPTVPSWERFPDFGVKNDGLMQFIDGVDRRAGGIPEELMVFSFRFWFDVLILILLKAILQSLITAIYFGTEKVVINALLQQQGFHVILRLCIMLRGALLC